jgi:hypothetical protein
VSAGPHEQATQAVLETGFVGATVEQRGPDGSTILAMLVFSICPACGAVVPNSAQSGDGEEIERDFILEHADYHLGVAKTLDEILERLGYLDEAVFPHA